MELKQATLRICLAIVIILVAATDGKRHRSRPTSATDAGPRDGASIGSQEDFPALGADTHTPASRLAWSTEPSQDPRRLPSVEPETVNLQPSSLEATTDAIASRNAWAAPLSSASPQASVDDVVAGVAAAAYGNARGDVAGEDRVSDAGASEDFPPLDSSAVDLPHRNAQPQSRGQPDDPRGVALPEDAKDDYPPLVSPHHHPQGQLLPVDGLKPGLDGENPSSANWSRPSGPAWQRPKINETSINNFGSWPANTSSSNHFGQRKLGGSHSLGQRYQQRPGDSHPSNFREQPRQGNSHRSDYRGQQRPGSSYVSDPRNQYRSGRPQPTGFNESKLKGPLANKTYSHLVLAIQWAGGVCADGYVAQQPVAGPASQRMCLQTNKRNHWTIHGLWPSDDYESPEFCSTETFDGRQLENLKGELNRMWPSFTSTQDRYFTFWRHEWQKHGTCASDIPQLRGIQAFFRAVLALSGRHDIKRYLENSNVSPTKAATFNVSDIIKAISDDYPYRFDVLCTTSQKLRHPVLTEIRFCLTKNLQPTHCRGRNIRCNSNGGNRSGQIYYLPAA